MAAAHLKRYPAKSRDWVELMKIVIFILFLSLSFLFSPNQAFACGSSDPVFYDSIIEYLFDNEIGAVILPYIEGSFGALILLVNLVLFLFLLIFSLVYRSLKNFKWSLLPLSLASIIFLIRASVSVFFC